MRTDYCQKLKVKAVIYRGNRIVGAGTNRPINPCDGVQCHHDGHCINTVHAEAAALMEAGEKAQGAYMRVTHEPCHQCRKMIIAAGIKRVYFEHKKHDSLNELYKGDVEWLTS
ncbi:hypothetical protein EPH95_02835 [Salicibibacter halophilus]|uniref:CMP/dCMP-type deaminase domain-containing protein n=1 Tax=Salicibibacter halophilus TaxID=2502791 RepID=A0A514LEG2_9BACI|nr:deaminase [Salicibibacter halophilus]QDI90237.1 hypothetical protein EPH95_02835 [Salicibibacter halophilus]